MEDFLLEDLLLDELLDEILEEKTAVTVRAVDFTSAEGKKKIVEAIKETVAKKKLKDGEYFATSASQIPQDKIKGFLNLKYKQGMTDSKKLITIGGYAALAVTSVVSDKNRSSEMYIFILNKNNPKKLKAVRVQIALGLRF